ncbi:hypothetical protein N7462_004419 [Penicillium macrosclerotiorum]|uniref:uncharacterized protein n=1 Tax=Penicillium macrosclerotiorum TaxID=303699 RepID=UPI002548DB55|nr:uncharacterized protein N7462_004419 [Penicillium macrosclerotiorum]KAJ5690027.1 hypothetical protein N7462_004419 [Penicillium macrosclerotiorum]
MAASSRQMLIESPLLGTEIDLENLSRQTSLSADGRRQTSQQQSHRRLEISIGESLRMNSRRDTIPDKVFEILSGHESLKKNYRKIARRPNLRTAERIFMYKATNTDELNFSKNDTWSGCLERILSSREINDDAVFEVCVISIDTTNIGRAFSFIDKLFLITYDRRQQAYSSLSEMIIRILHIQWRLSDEIMAEVMESLHAKQLSLSSWQPKLPSDQGHAPINIVPHVPLKFEFKWIRAPHYATDLSVYVFRPYGKHPQAETLDVILTSSQYEQVRRAIVVVNSHNTLAKLRSGKFFTHVLEHNMFSLSYILHLFEAVCSEVIAGFVTFTTRACKEINYLVYEGRLRPSGSKMQYLLHLEDCHLVTKSCCRANKQTLQSLLDRINSIQGPRADEEMNQIRHLELFMKDLDYLHDEVESSLLRISNIRHDLRENLDLLQIHRTSILGILAALYLPLSFVTSFLGMNLNQYTTPQPFWRNATVIDGTTSNKLIVDSGTNQTWSLVTFFAIAMPLMVGTILVPLVIGSIIRVLLQGLAQGRTWWRLLFAFVVLWLDTIISMMKERRIANGFSTGIPS